MSLLLALLHVIVPPDTKNQFGGGMFVQVIRAHNKRKTAPIKPRFTEYESDSKMWEGFKEFPNSTGKNLAPVAQKPTPKQYKGHKQTSNSIINLSTIQSGGVAKQNIERVITEELAIQARINQNNAIALLLLLAS